ncbi:MAG: recombinase zinc beta ribbon domain-containing protein, partial [Pseudomonadota bacterium]
REAVIAFLDAHPHENFVVIFDDLKRYARDTEFHLKLRREMQARGAIRECLNFNFEDSPEGEFFETIVAAQGQLEREQNRRQVIQKMRARVEKGYYCFAPPPGYSYIEADDGGKVLGPDANASLVREALEGFASGRFQTATEVMRFFHRNPLTPNNRHGPKPHLQTVFDILRRPIYAGYITVEKWGLHLQPGKHEPLISFATWQRIQSRLDGNANAPFRKDLHQDFPLRGFVQCASCGNAMTAAWSKGRTRLYPYYLCQTRNCDLKGKSIRRDKIEGELETLLKALTPAPQLLKMFRAMFEDRWAAMQKQSQSAADAARGDLKALERQSAKLMERLLGADSPSLISAYEAEIENLEAKKIAASERINAKADRRVSFDEMYRTACAFLASPCKIWKNGSWAQRRIVLRLVFPRPVTYCRNEGYRTPEIALPFKVLAPKLAEKLGVVEGAGFEPA